MNFKDRTGERCGRLTVLERADDFVCSSGRKLVMWKCICDCGNYCTVAASSIQSKLTKSCGCYNSEVARNGDIKHHTHKAKSKDATPVEKRLYEIWIGMKKRCSPNATNNKRYKNYAGRGIKVCDEWSNSYEAFRSWALGNGYDGYATFGECTLDRIDNNGNYCPENCRWADATTQQRNKNNNFLITFNGETKTLAEWSEITGISRHAISDRIKELNWDIETALTKPVKKSAKQKREQEVA